MKKILFLTVLLLVQIARAQVTLDSTNIPIVAVYTFNQAIVNDPKIDAYMAIIDNGYNNYNEPTDTNYTYYGNIGIEIRGSISQWWWFLQKSYALETRDINGLDSNAVMLDMPEETDWILYSPYDDRTLMRNVITYDLASEMGYWAPRSKFCELLLNESDVWEYKGVYVMMEKIKRDANRVDIAKLDADENTGDELTGGYIFAVDQNINEEDSVWASSYQSDLFYSYKYPKEDVITPEQKEYLQAYVDSFETACAAPDFDDPVNGFRKFMVDTTFMDFFFIQELSKSVDCYKRSAYMYKDKASNGGRIHAGPVWDFNSAWHNIALCAELDAYDGWAYQQSCWVNDAYPVPAWWEQILQDTVFTNELNCRWWKWRENELSNENIFTKMDSIANYISEAQQREYEQYGFTEDFETEVENLQEWIAQRLQWMDENMMGNCWPTGVIENGVSENLFSVYPNPSSGTFSVYNPKAKDYDLEIYDALGKIVLSETKSSTHAIVKLDVPAGIYWLKIGAAGSAYLTKVIVADEKFTEN